MREGGWESTERESSNLLTDVTTTNRYTFNYISWNIAKAG